MKISTSSVIGLALALTTASCAPEPCTVADNADGTYTLTCPDGTSATVGNGVDGAAWLVSTADEPAGANCPDGGQAVSVGPDTDGDGQLSSGEVATTTYVCDGADGADGTSYLVDVQDEPAGENCANGGVVISVGPDDNDNGFLDEEEVASVDYVCDGVNGAPGEDAIPTLVATVDEPAGSNCENGGLAVQIGVDDNLDGVLDDAEVDSTTYVCDGLDGEDGTSGSGGGGAFADVGFPTSSSTLYSTFSTTTLGSGGGGVIYVSGSYVEQDFTDTGLSSVSGLDFVFLMNDSTSSSCTVGTLDFDVKLNGTTVGTYSYVGGSRRGTIMFDDQLTFSAVSGKGGGVNDDYTIRLEAADTVCSGGGSYNWYPGGVFFLRP